MPSDHVPLISCAFAPSLETADHITLAESLGYHRATVFDSPALYADPWMVLTMAATRTTTIGLGVATLVPSLRHPMVNAAALATLAALAPGRVSATFGTGLTGRMSLGQKPMRWADVSAYVSTVRALLRGEEVEWDGRLIALIHPPGFPAQTRVDAAVFVAADGPVGSAVASDLGDAVVTARKPSVAPDQDVILLSFGTVLDDCELPASDRAVAAAAPALAVGYHAAYEAQGEAVDRMPGGAAWRESVEKVDADRRHLEIHAGHLVHLNRHDDVMLPHAVHLLPRRTMTASRADIHERLTGLAAAGVTEIAYQPMGADIPRELRAFAEAAQL